MAEEQEVEVIDGMDEEPNDMRGENYHSQLSARIRVSGKSARMDALTWAVILIWAGTVMLAENMGHLSRFIERFNLRLAEVPWHLPVSHYVWTVFFFGLGVILLLGVLIRIAVPNFRHDVLGNAILAIVAFAVAIGRAELIWPLILIALGVAIVFRRM